MGLPRNHPLCAINEKSGDQRMKTLRHARASFLSIALMVFVQPTVGLAQTAKSVAKATPQETTAARDGQHDFDFVIGTWKTHVSRLVNPLTGDGKWIVFDGSVATRKVWNGRANLEEIDVDEPTGRNQHLTLRLYNPQSHEWSLNGGNINDGVLDPPLIGKFENGRGEFFDHEQFNGRTIMVRDVFSEITANSHHFEQSFSADEGKTWEPNWIATLTRVK
jgi:hypothetical protein